MLFTPDERRALLAIAGLVLLGLGTRWVLPPPRLSMGGGDSLLTVLAARTDALPSTVEAPPSGIAEEGRLRVNGAQETDLVVLPGVGPALARRIVEERTDGGPFRDTADLERVRGIGPVLAARLAPLLSFAPVESSASADCTAVSQHARPVLSRHDPIPRN